MQNNSKTNTILLIIIAIFLAVIAYALFEKPQMNDTDKAVQKKEIVNDEGVNSNKTFLINLFKTYPNLFAIRECTYQNNTYFSVQPEGTGDAGFVIYDSKGTIYARGGGFSGTGSSKEFLMVSPTCTKLIYRKTYNLSNQNPDIIDIYHLNP